MRVLDNAGARFGLMILAFGVVALVAIIVSCSQGEADTLTGSIDQSVSATDDGIIIEAYRAQFSGTAVAVELSTRAVDDAHTVAGVSLVGAELEEVAATSARVRRDGTTVLRFPVEAWPEDVPAARLSIREVTVFDERGGLVPLAGDWELAIELPEGDEAAAARTVQALEAVAMELAGQEITVETLLTHSATVIRYELPATAIVSVPQPTLRAGDAVVEPIRSEQRGDVNEHWYGPVGESGSLTLAFDGVVVSEPIESPWTLELTLDVQPIPRRSSDPDQPVVSQELRWRLERGVGAPEVRSVAVQRRPNDVHLEITVDGSWWRPGPTPPVVVGDGAEMEVATSGWSTPDGQVESSISVRLEDSVTPGELVVTAAEREVTLPHAEVVLRP